MIYLSVPPSDERLWPYANNLIGIMATPNMGTSVFGPGRVVVWAADNGCFTKGADFDLLTYYLWLNERRPFCLSCLFATAPDVVGDADATWQRSADCFEGIRTIGYRAALVGQDGCEDHAATWDEHESWDWLFLGGSTEWKVSKAAQECTQRARQLGKGVHMGRVNSFKRLALADAWGCDSADGTFVAFGPDINLPKLITWLDRLNWPTQTTLFEEGAA